MAQVIKIQDMIEGMTGFVNYFEANLLNKSQVTKDNIDIAFRLLYNKPRNGSSCSSCMTNVYNQLKDIYMANKPQEIIVEEVVIEEVKQDLTLTKKKK